MFSQWNYVNHFESFRMFLVIYYSARLFFFRDLSNINTSNHLLLWQKNMWQCSKIMWKDKINRLHYFLLYTWNITSQFTEKMWRFFFSIANIFIKEYIDSSQTTNEKYLFLRCWTEQLVHLLIWLVWNKKIYGIFNRCTQIWNTEQNYWYISVSNIVGTQLKSFHYRLLIRKMKLELYL